MPRPQFSIRTLLWLTLAPVLVFAFAFALLRLMFLVNPLLMGGSIDYAAGYSALVIASFLALLGLWCFIDWRLHHRKDGRAK